MNKVSRGKHTQGRDFTPNRSQCDVLAVYARGQTINQSIGFWFLDMNPTIVSAVTHLSTAWWEEIRAIKDRHSTRTFPDEEAQTTVPTSSFSFRCPFLDQQRVTVSFLLQFSERQTTRTAKYPGSEAYCNCLTCSLCKHPALTIWRIKLALRFL